MNKIKPISTLPAVLAVFGVYDGGPCTDGMGTAICPHCGAEGRYVVNFLCDDGTKRGAMAGCFQLFPGSNTRTAKLVQEAFSRKRDLKPGSKLAGWWADMIAECEEFGMHSNGSKEDVQLFSNRIFDIESRRQAWLSKNGYGKFGKRRAA